LQKRLPGGGLGDCREGWMGFEIIVGALIGLVAAVWFIIKYRNDRRP
jgi:hypothetical protein